MSRSFFNPLADSGKFFSSCFKANPKALSYLLEVKQNVSLTQLESKSMAIREAIIINHRGHFTHNCKVKPFLFVSVISVGEIRRSMNCRSQDQKLSFPFIDDPIVEILEVAKASHAQTIKVQIVKKSYNTYKDQMKSYLHPFNE